MARIAIIMNEHPNEVVAHHQARAVGEILRKAGHEVVEYRYPLSKTLLGIINKTKKMRPLNAAEKMDLRKQIAAIMDSDIITDAVKSETGADFAFNFHTTPEEVLFASRREAKKGFMLEAAPFDPANVGIEIGCKYATHPNAEANKRIYAKLVSHRQAERHFAAGNEENYLTRTCPIQQNSRRLSPALSHKIAAAIISHMRLTRASGA